MTRPTSPSPPPPTAMPPPGRPILEPRRSVTCDGSRRAPGRKRTTKLQRASRVAGFAVSVRGVSGDCPQTWPFRRGYGSAQFAQRRVEGSEARVRLVVVPLRLDDVTHAHAACDRLLR